MPGLGEVSPPWSTERVGGGEAEEEPKAQDRPATRAGGGVGRAGLPVRARSLHCHRSASGLLLPFLTPQPRNPAV